MRGHGSDPLLDLFPFANLMIASLPRVSAFLVPVGGRRLYLRDTASALCPGLLLKVHFLLFLVFMGKNPLRAVLAEAEERVILITWKTRYQNV